MLLASSVAGDAGLLLNFARSFEMTAHSAPCTAYITAPHAFQNFSMIGHTSQRGIRVSDATAEYTLRSDGAVRVVNRCRQKNGDWGTSKGVAKQRDPKDHSRNCGSAFSGPLPAITGFSL
jgi:hypothetical protein